MGKPQIFTAMTVLLNCNRESWPTLNWKHPCSVNETNFFRCCVEWCNIGLNPVTPGASRWTACAFLEMRPNEKAWGGSIQSYVNAPFVDAGAIPIASTEPHAGLSSHFYTHTSNQVPSTYTYNRKHFAFYILSFIWNAHFRQSSNSLLHANYLWLHCTLCFKGQLLTKWG